MILRPRLIGGMDSAPPTDIDLFVSVLRAPFYLSPCNYECPYCPHPSNVPPPSLVQQLQPAGVAVISADFAVWLVEAGRVSEGRRDGMEVRDGDGVPWRRG